MDRKRIVLIKTNLIDRDPRLAREVDALKRGGYAITLLCWDRDCKTSYPEQQETDGYHREIRLRLKAPYGIMILPFLPIWWCFEFLQLLKTSWDIVQVINFDAVAPAVVAAKLKKCPIIYEIVDVYVDMILLPRLLRHVGVYIDRIFMRLVNAIIIANEAHPKELNGIPNSNVVGVFNSPPDFFKKSNVQRNDEFTLFFAGVLQKSRHMNLDRVCQATRDIDGVELVIAGYGDQSKEIEEWAKEAAHRIKFIGKISYTEVLERTIRSDLLFALYEPVVPTVRYAGGNKLFEAMMAGKPILVSKGTAMADIVEQESCGLVVDSNSVDEIRKAIVRLKEDTQLYRQLGANGRRAYEQRYSWEIMEQRLVALYEEMTR
jgi:glycosyltransferase involved in cell wall biosynthesis